jgi:5-methylcytosine-specific restriction protein A
MKNTGPSKKVRAQVAKRDQGVCQRCQVREAADLQHRIGRGSGGTSREIVNDVSALVSVCRSCHDWIERGEREQAYATGWAIRRSSSELPSEIPLVDLLGREFFLTEECRIVYINPLVGFYPTDPAEHVRRW